MSQRGILRSGPRSQHSARLQSQRRRRVTVLTLVSRGAVSYVLSQWQDTIERFGPADRGADDLDHDVVDDQHDHDSPAATTTTTTVRDDRAGDRRSGAADGVIRWESSRRRGSPLQGDPVPGSRPAEMSSVINFVGSQFSAGSSIDAGGDVAGVTIAVPRAADNADPLGLWVEAPNWQLMPPAADPVAPNGPASWQSCNW